MVWKVIGIEFQNTAAHNAPDYTWQENESLKLAAAWLRLGRLEGWVEGIYPYIADTALMIRGGTLAPLSETS